MGYEAEVEGTTRVMSDHAGLNKKLAAHTYSDHFPSQSST
jgi:hypothetical protein